MPSAGSGVSWNEIVDAVSASPPQLIKPHIATTPKATITRIERIVLTIPTSLTPRMLIIVNMAIIANLSANSAGIPISHTVAAYPPARITYDVLSI